MTKSKKASPGTFRSLTQVGKGQGMEIEPILSAEEVEELPIPMSGEVAKDLGIRGIKWIEAYKEKGTYLDAYCAVFPKAQRATSAGNASRYAAKVIKAVGGSAAWWEALGISLGAIARTVETGMNATIQRQFVIAKTGEIVTAPVQPDIPTRLVAARLASQLRGATKEGIDPDDLVVNIIMYNRPGDKPWPTHHDTIDVTPNHDTDPDFPDGKPWE